MKKPPVRLVSVLSILLAVVAGCSEPRAALSGKVTYKDKALHAGTVIFLSEDGTKQDRAEIQPDGAYSSSTVPVGNLKVGVLPAPKGAKSMMPKGAKRPKIAEDDPLAKVYGNSGADYVDIPEPLRNPETSNITVKVDANTKTFDITLKAPK
jgi:hypothetical protein